MNLDPEDLDEMVSKGRKVKGLVKPAPPEDSREIKLLEGILKAVAFQASRPLPEPPAPPKPVAPIVNVAPAPVTFQPSEPITKWKFTLTKNKAGHTTEIIATAIP